MARSAAGGDSRVLRDVGFDGMWLLLCLRLRVARARVGAGVGLGGGCGE